MAPEYDLEKRTFDFAVDVRKFIYKQPREALRQQDFKQVLRSSGSIGANYIEAKESFSKKDELLRLKICRKEAKESEYWLKLIADHLDVSMAKECQALTNEAGELTRILSVIVTKLQQKLVS